MDDQAARLASRLIRNFREVAIGNFVREPLYASAGARLATGTDAGAFEAIQRPAASLDYWEGEP